MGVGQNCAQPVPWDSENNLCFVDAATAQSRRSWKTLGTVAASVDQTGKSETVTRRLLPKASFFLHSCGKLPIATRETQTRILRPMIPSVQIETALVFAASDTFKCDTKRNKTRARDVLHGHATARNPQVSTLSRRAKPWTQVVPLQCNITRQAAQCRCARHQHEPWREKIRVPRRCERLSEDVRMVCHSCPFVPAVSVLFSGVQDSCCFQVQQSV